MFTKTSALVLMGVMVAMLLTSVLARADTNQGFIYGVVTTESGTEYKGFLRWGDQEAFWDDLFHSSKVDLPFLEELDKDDRRKERRKPRKKISVFENWNFTFVYGEGSGRMLISRFGDIKTIEPHGEGEATLFMKSGAELDVSGGADDVTSKIHVNDPSLGQVEVHWDRIERIKFMEAPADADPGVWRLYGKLETREGDFEGFIQWDKQECVNVDLLDGDNDDGDISIKMGQIRSIERHNKHSSNIVLKDGRAMRLHGSNDVNSENRGIMVEDSRYGRVTCGWGSFVRLTFSDPPGSGRGYDEYHPLGALKGTVTDDRGRELRGRIVFDLDENEGWEILNGQIDDVHFDIPFYRIASIEVLGSRGSMVTLRDGEKLELEEGTDVSGRNAGVLVFTDGEDDPEYMEWRDVETIVFDW